MKAFIKFNCFVALLFSLLFLQSSCKNSNKEAPSAAAKDTTLKVSRGNEYQNIDQSPMDISYCPAEYPQNKMKGIATSGPVARVIYSRPHKKGRTIFSNDTKSLCQYGKPWRLGANESTEIEFFEPVMIGGKNMQPGRYVMYCIPYPDKWQIIFNSNLNSWGLHMDSSKDVFQTEIPVQQQSPAIEDFTMLFQETAEGADLLMTWDNVKALLPVTFSK
ncbi:MAG: DUF2911 domain-containing protein [Sphingobacteriales bacterium]|nr:MAG: DUF2911 domain-containing protein [Sphingobacteriales bacterium]